jgi:hypothetical protein
MTSKPTLRITLVAALVTAVAVLLTFYSTASATPFNLTIPGTVAATVPGTVAGVMSTCQVTYSSSTVDAGNTQTFLYSAFDPANNDITSLVSVAWTVTGAGSLSTVSGKQVTFLAEDTGSSSSIQATGTQSTLTCAADAVSLTIVPPSAVPAAPTPTPVTTVIVAAADVTPVPVPAGGSVTVIQPNASVIIEPAGADLSVVVPEQITAKTSQLEYKPIVVANITTPPPAVNVVKAFELNLHDDKGQALTNVVLLTPITVRAKYTQADADAAGCSDGSCLSILQYRGGVWVTLVTTHDVVAKELVASVGHLSLFAIGGVFGIGVPTPTPAIDSAVALKFTPITTPPVVGGTAPGSNFLLMVGVVAVVLIATSGYYVRQTRQRQDF